MKSLANFQFFLLMPIIRLAKMIKLQMINCKDKIITIVNQK